MTCLLLTDMDIKILGFSGNWHFVRKANTAEFSLSVLRIREYISFQWSLNMFMQASSFCRCDTFYFATKAS